MYSIHTTEVFEDWFTGLKDRMVKVRIQARIDRAEDGNFGDSQPVGGGVSEMRLHFGAGWRIYYTVRGGEIVVLLAVAASRINKRILTLREIWRSNFRSST